jgi:hypothetical protein
MSKRIFIGLSNTAGYGTRLLKEFNNAGIEADLYLIGKHPFDFDISSSYIMKRYSNIWINRIYMRFFILKCLFRYDAFIFLEGQSLLSGLRDFWYYRLFRKKTMMIFLGCDVQQPELTFKKEIPFSACHNCQQEYKDYVGCVPEKKIIRTRKIERLADIIVSHPAFSDVLKRDYLKIVQPVNIQDFPETFNFTPNKIPVILHAPSNFGYKGTKFLLEAVEKLKKEFEFSFRMVQNVKLNELYDEISKADLVIDQLIQGWYGLLPLEAMMYKKPVICYLRDDVIKSLPGACPVINANQDTIYSVLKDKLENRSTWVEIGEKGREYVIKFHDGKLVAKHYSELLLN